MLQHDFAGITIELHKRIGAVEGILRIVKPLIGGVKSAQTLDSRRFLLGDVVVDSLR